MEALIPRKGGVMSAPNKCHEVRDRAIRLVDDLLADDQLQLSVTGACRRVGEQLGINRDTLRGWVKQAQIDAGARPGVSSDDRRRLVDLERENRELRRANAILKTASAFSRRSSTAHRHAREVIEEHRHDRIDGAEFGVEPICRVLWEHGCLIAPSSYYAARTRPACDRVIRDAELPGQIRRVHADNYGVMGPARCGVSCAGKASRWPAAPWNG
jgi:transposase-like protein